MNKENQDIITLYNQSLLEGMKDWAASPMHDCPRDHILRAWERNQLVPVKK